MAVTTSLFINNYGQPEPSKKYPVSVRVTFERIKKYYPTGIKLKFSDFEKAQGPKPRLEFKELSLKLQAFEKKAVDIIEKLPVFTFEAFEKRYYSNKGTKDTINAAFADCAAELRKNGQIGNAVNYECAEKSLEKFAPGAKFADVTPGFLHRYEYWMLMVEDKEIKKKKNSITTVSMYLRSLRALFNDAITEGILSKEYYPFGKKLYEIPTGNNVKKALTLKDIGAIYYYEPKAGSMEARAKDYWIFMYLCNGMNVKDMCLLTYAHIKGDVIEFIRAKTARTKRKVEPIRVVYTDEVKAIVNKWGNRRKDIDTFIFPVLEKGLTPERERQLIQQLTGVINDHMKAIATKLKIESNLTTYVARHSFSSILQRSGKSTEFISEALGHANVKTTANYLAGFEDDSKKEAVKALIAFPKSEAV